jgi:hypothetical protein
MLDLQIYIKCMYMLLYKYKKKGIITVYLKKNDNHQLQYYLIITCTNVLINKRETKKIMGVIFVELSPSSS